jgi:hypothetical protein
VVWVGGCVIIGGMTTRASIRRIVIITLVTSVAIICDGNMRSGKWINRIMVETGG